MPRARLSRLLLLALIALPLPLALVGAVYQALTDNAEARRFPEPGHLVNIGGRRLPLNCTGQGSPAVILESGLGDGLNEWRSVQPEIQKFSRVCSYDRAGYGASDPGPMPPTSAQAASDLHALLASAGVKPPYVLVGHSLGGYHVRVFNGAYPAEVSGIVLVDSTREDQYDLLPPAWNDGSAALLQRYRSQARWAPLFIGLGWQPADEREQELVDQLIDDAWRLRRLRRAETQIYTGAIENRRTCLAHRPHTETGDAFSGWGDTLSRLQRLVTSMKRSSHQTTVDLERLQAARRKAPPVLPLEPEPQSVEPLTASPHAQTEVAEQCHFTASPVPPAPSQLLRPSDFSPQTSPAAVCRMSE